MTDLDTKTYLIQLKAEQRFAEKVNQDGPIPKHAPHLGKCWLWTAAKFWCGYGTFFFLKKQWYSHRLSYHIFVGEIPKGIQVLHRCDNRLCVNPEHLFLGTNRDNVDDKMKKGRNSHMKGPKWSQFIKSVQPRGEKSSCAKLTDENVLEIRKLYTKGSSQFGTTGLSKVFGIPRSHVWAIVHRKAWVHI